MYKGIKVCIANAKESAKVSLRSLGGILGADRFRTLISDTFPSDVKDQLLAAAQEVVRR